MPPNAETTSTQTTCPYCGVGCGVVATLSETGQVTVKGDKSHPANEGRMCSKGTALGDTVYLQERLLYPEIGDEQVSWDQALNTVAGEFSRIVREHGPDSVAFYVSGQLLTEDYYVANKLMKGYIGSANIDTNSRLCMSSAVAAYKRAFGEDCVPNCYDDLERAKLIVLTGSNAAWCHPVLYQRIVKAKKNNPDLFVVLIDPRRTQTESVADLHLAIKPGRDAVLFNGLLACLDEAGEKNELFADHFTTGMEEALDAARRSAPDVASVAATCELEEADVQEFFRLFARTERVVTVFSQGTNQSSSGVDKANAIINCHLFSGRIGRPGMGPFSFTGQPNAMGGREVGGLSNQLAAHMELSNPEHRERVQRFWQSPAMPQREGLKAVDLFANLKSGKLKAVWIMATNPVVSLPEADAVREALQACELVVVSDCVRETDTVKLAHIKLPALTWGERDGTVTNTERCISRQRPFLPEPGQARADWWIITEVARRMGFGDGFPYTAPVEIFREHAALSAFENKGERMFNIGAFSDISAEDYEALKPVRWPVTPESPRGTDRLYGNGKFNTPDGKARFVPITPRDPVSQPDSVYPYVLNTGRVRDHWHTLTRTGMSPRLCSHTFEPYVEIHPDDAAREGVEDAALARVDSPNGYVFVRVRVSDRQRRGSLFVPMHWSDQFSSQGRVGSLVKAVVDPVSGQPESKHSVARISKCRANWHGFILSRRGNLDLYYSTYWARSRGRGLWRYEIAGLEQPEDWAQRARSLLALPKRKTDWAEFYDSSQNHYRAAQFTGNRLESCIFIGPTEKLPPRDWLISLFQEDELDKAARASLLTGEPPAEQEDTGRIVCACFNVGEKTIQKAIAEFGLDSPEAIGEKLQAGTNCGSCIPELRDLLAAK